MRLLNKIFKLDRDKGVIPKKLIAKYLPPDPIIIEAGAHVGVDTTEMARFWPQAKIYAFEPVPSIFKQLKKATSSFRSIKSYQLALGQKNGVSNIHISSGESDGSSSILKPKEHLSLHPNVSFSKSIEIKVTSLDSWAKSQGIKHIDFLWLDLQGYELTALKGATKVLESVKAIHTEVNLVEVYQGAPMYTDLKKWLEKKGFKVVFEAVDWADGGNVLFVRS